MHIDKAKKDSQRAKQTERYKQDEERGKRFVLRALRVTRMSMVDIAKHAGYKSAIPVRKLNVRAQIRPPELAKAIGNEAVARKLLRKRVKKNLFSIEQKKKLTSSAP